MVISVSSSVTPPTMGTTQIFTINENTATASANAIVTTYLKCFDVDATKERTPACAIALSANSAVCNDDNQVASSCVASYCESVKFEFAKKIQCQTETQLQIRLSMLIQMAR